ncbi:MAG: DUF465 domain-containing protein [Desulfovibrio sp.]|jgi:uncharacterized protein YdcH (DUF465 family)|nr:DUF465 domain-containing protein [Desulfovibrio sp.]
MDQRDFGLLEKHMSYDPELKSLWEDHVLYKNQVEKLENKTFRTPIEERTLKQLKKQKLEAKTRLMEILDSLRVSSE